jgi:hypothetical protein
VRNSPSPPSAHMAALIVLDLPLLRRFDEAGKGNAYVAISRSLRLRSPTHTHKFSGDQRPGLWRRRHIP